MDYKKIFRSRRLRHKILKCLSFVPDKTMLRIQYRIKLKRLPNLGNPRRFTEKIQLYKLHYRNPELSVCVDKFRVRKFIKDKGLQDILPELYGVYKKAEEIDFNELPSKFVVKTNDGGGGNNVLLCRDKSQLDVPSTIRMLNSWLDVKSINAGREWAYTGIPESLIVIEELLENKENPEGGIDDFKFFCFNGEPYCIVHDGERYIGHKRNFYDLDWNNLEIGSDCMSFGSLVPKPSKLKEMIEVARHLSVGFPFVRVDLYSVEDKVYFGELTFYPWSGYVQFEPDDFDFRLGENFNCSSFCSQATL